MLKCFQIIEEVAHLRYAEHTLKNRAMVNYDSIPYINGTLLLHLAAGVYFSLFTLKKGRPRIDVGFLAVTFLPLLRGLTLGYGLLKQRPQA
ncbi:hypothetical protein [Paenibacillus donghaensis]|uniref:Uncharacterized protein n=1 Tax=Paenibacillus donghaensis TaxID=414771 RepID=A0A2Z2KSV4_9BACL|nr:hypothetical protein [Paenibacillus donghaensis]ASA19380.1 hypothetical protein B9T62_00035 [Paenibacillus donghaensis]ASA26099.1 hypothetical protein B9T62_38550 [Paenibacillus donghaensis]